MFFFQSSKGGAVIHVFAWVKAQNFQNPELKKLKSYAFKTLKLFPCLPRLLSSADKLCKQFVPKSALTECPSCSGSKSLGALIVFLKELFENLKLI